MRTVLPISLAFLVAAMAAGSDSAFNGRWNITVPNEPRARAWWLEVTGAGTPAIAGKFVGAPGGQLDVIPTISVASGNLEFVFERRYGRGSPNKGLYRARIVDGKLQGTFEVDGMPERKLTFTGVRAPEIREKDDGSWKPGKPVELVNGKNLSGWHSRLPDREIGWSVREGVLNNGTPPVPDLVTDGTFWNFALHVEYRIGKGSNSGIGLRGRYEVQIYDDHGKNLSLHGNGAVYSRILPSMNASRAPGEWQTLDIRLVGREVTVVLNDRKIIDRREIEGLTAMATDANEDRPGPIILQGDHGPVEFRKITLTPLTHGGAARRE
jgi:hypothetical protein